MPLVKVGYRTLYDGPSLEDANMIYEMCKMNLSDHGVLFFSPKPSSQIPRGVIGKVIGRLNEQIDVRNEVAREAIRNFKHSMPMQALANNNTWNSNPSVVPPKTVISNLLANSVAEDYSTAQTEWEYNGEIIYEDEHGFTRECGLCGPKDLMKMNFIIRNARNGKALQVGSVCIKRFLILAGTTSQYESADLFDRRTMLAYYGRKQGYLIAGLTNERVSERSIIELLSTFEEAFPYGITWEDADIIIREANVDEEAGSIFKALVFHDASVMRRLSESMVKMSNRSEKWQKRVKTRVLSTLSKSSAFRND